MTIGNQSASRSSLVGPRGVSNERRDRRHLRELCDEVLASYRVATTADPFSDSDRASARSMIWTISGANRRRTTR